MTTNVSSLITYLLDFLPLFFKIIHPIKLQMVVVFELRLCSTVYCYDNLSYNKKEYNLKAIESIPDTFKD